MSADQAEPGMVLANPVTDRQGRLLIPAGKELTDRHVQALHVWGVPHVDVEGDEPDDHHGAVDPECTREAEEALTEHFLRSGRPHPFLDALFDACVTRRARRIQQARGDDHAR